LILQISSVGTFAYSKKEERSIIFGKDEKLWGRGMGGGGGLLGGGGALGVGEPCGYGVDRGRMYCIVGRSRVDGGQRGLQ
jgi:hypothetical protein